MTWEGELFSSLAFPGRFETDAVVTRAFGLPAAPRPGRRTWWGQKLTDLLALFFTQTRSVRRDGHALRNSQYI